MPTPFEARAKAGRMVALVIGAGVLIAASAYIVFAPGALRNFPRYGWLFYWAGVIGMPFFGLCLLVILRQAFSGRAQVRIDGSGLYWRRWGERPIPFTEIAEAWPMQVVGQRFVCLRLRHPEDYPPKSFALRASAGANRAIGAGDVQITMQALEKSSEQLAAALAVWGVPLRGV